MGNGGERGNHGPGALAGDRAKKNSGGDVCLPRAVLFGDLHLSEIRAYALLLEAGREGLTAPDAAAAMRLPVRNARRALTGLAAKGLALEGKERGPDPVGAGVLGPAGRGALKRFVSPRALEEAHPAAGVRLERAGRTGEAARPADPGNEARGCERREVRGEARGQARAAKGSAKTTAGGAPDVASGGSSRKTYDTLTERCLEVLSKFGEFPANRANNARKIHEFRCAFPFADCVKACEEYVRYHRDKPAGHTRDHHARLKKFFEVRNEDGARERGAQPLPTETDAPSRAVPEEESAAPAPLPPPDPQAEAAKDRLIDAVSEADGRRRDHYFRGFVAADLFPDGTLVLVCEKEDYASFIRDKWRPILEARRAVVASSADYAEASYLKAAGRPPGVEPAPGAVQRAAG